MTENITGSGTLPSDTGERERDAKAGIPPVKNEGIGTLPSGLSGQREREAKGRQIDAEKSTERKSKKSSKKKSAPKATDEEKAADEQAKRSKESREEAEEAQEKTLKAQEKAPKGICQFCHTLTNPDENTCGEHRIPKEIHEPNAFA